MKLTYFDARGRAEAIRLALTIAEKPFEDERIDSATFRTLKPSLPYKSLPILTVDETVFAQSMSILRYVGKITGLYPTDALKALQVDEILDTIADLGAGVYRGEDKDRMRAERERWAKEDVPKFFGGMEKRIGLFGNGPFVTGEEMSIADLVVSQFVIMIRAGILDYVAKDVLDGFPKLVRAHDGVMEHPKVSEWYKKHPVKVVA